MTKDKDLIAAIKDDELLSVMEDIRSHIVRKPDSGEHRIIGTGNDEEMIRLGLMTPKDIIFRLLREKGYAVKEKMGEGHTREVYKITNKELGQDRVVKIPKQEKSESITTLINQSKRDLDRNEIRILQHLEHPNIIHLIDAVPTTHGTVNIEEFFEGRSLAEIGKLSPSEFKEIGGQTLDALIYMNEKRGIFHRDIKPSNILVSKGWNEPTIVKVNDLQNAALEEDIEEVSYPTRGGTAYTHPLLLNALLGTSGKATLETEAYAATATLYEMLTGMKPFSYELVRDPNGVPLQIGDEYIKVSISDRGGLHGEPFNQITKEMHKQRVEEAVKRVDKKYKKMFRKGLSFDNGFERVSDLKKEFDVATKATKEKFLESTSRIGKAALISAAIAFAGAAGAIGVLKSEGSVSKPQTLQDVLLEQSRFDAIAGYKIQGHRMDAIPIIAHNESDKALKRMQDYVTGEDQPNLLLVERSLPQINTQLAAPLLRAIQKYREDLPEDEDRAGIYYAPKSFHGAIGADDLELLDDPDRAPAFMARFIQSCYQNGDSIGDVYVKALLSRDEIEQAVRNISLRYLVDTTPHMHGATIPIRDMLENLDVDFDLFPKVVDGRMIPGYIETIDPAKAQVIRDACMIYAVTEKDGTISPHYLQKIVGSVHGSN